MAKIAHLQRFVNMDLVGDPAVAQLLHPENLEQQCRQVGHHWRDTFWSPAVTFLTFLLQILSAEKEFQRLTPLATRLRLFEAGGRRGGNSGLNRASVWADNTGGCRVRPADRSGAT